MNKPRSLTRNVAFVSTCAFLIGCGRTDSPPPGSGDASGASAARQITAAPAQNTTLVPLAVAKTLNSEAEYEKGAALAADGKLDEARLVFQAAAGANPQHSSLAAVVAIYRDVDEGRVTRDAIHRMFRAMHHANAGRWADAHADADEAVKLAPAYVRAHDTSAQVFLLQGKHEDAIKGFNRVLAIDSKFAQGYYNRGATYAYMGRHDAAIADYTRAIELQPSFSDAYCNRGSAYTFKNDVQAAMADYAKAHELDPHAVEPIYLRGVLFALLRQWNEAVADFTRAIERDPDHAESYYDRGVSYQNQGNDDRALADFAKAIELNPANPAALINRGLILMRRKGYDPAISDFDKALSLAPAMVVAQYNKALALDQSGRAKEAVAAYRTFLPQATPEHAALAKHARERLTMLEK